LSRAQTKKEGRARVSPALFISAIEAYSSSIWLYSTLSNYWLLAAPFRIGVLHLVAQRAVSDRLDDKGEIRSKRTSIGGKSVQETMLAGASTPDQNLVIALIEWQEPSGNRIIVGGPPAP